MMTAKYVYRLDDVTSTMDMEKFIKFMDLFARYQVVPLIGVIPDNQDPELKRAAPSAHYLQLIQEYKDAGRIEIAQHGFEHTYTTRQRGYRQLLLGHNTCSEFAGLPYPEQRRKIADGMAILRAQGMASDIWMAPSHTQDKVTYRALKDLGFQYVTDGMAAYPYRKHGLVFVPQQLWKPEKKRFGIYTICLHLNDATDELYQRVEKHLQSGAIIIKFSEAAKTRPAPYHCIGNVCLFLRRCLQIRLIWPLKKKVKLWLKLSE